MNCEIKQILYKPETYDKDGNIKTEAYFAINMNVEISEETREALMEIIAGASPHAYLELKPSQPALPLLPSIREEINEDI